MRILLSIFGLVLVFSPPAAGREDTTATRAPVQSPRFSTYKENYFLLTTIDQYSQTKFQFSLKYRLFDGTGFYFGYTQKSFWNAWGSPLTSALRETNFNPEFLYDFAESPFWILPPVTLGLEHESNGKDGLDARSWNRAYVQWKTLSSDSVAAVRLKSWVPFMIVAGNPDILNYLGYTDFEFDWNLLHRPELLSFQIDVRKGANLDLTRSSVLIGFVIKPFELLDWKSLSVLNGSFYFQYFNGYGESLENYNVPLHGLRAGFIVME